jgi:hypothetical protein
MGNCISASEKSKNNKILPNDLTSTDIDRDHGAHQGERVLTGKQIRTVQSKPTGQQKTNQPLDDVSGHLSREQFSDDARDTTRQRRVSNDVRHSECRHQEEESKERRSETIQIRDPILKKQSQLVELIDSKNGLLVKMVSAGCLSYEQKKTLEASQTERATNEGILAIVEKAGHSHGGSCDCRSKFIDCLIQTNQRHAAWLLAPEKLRDVRPLCE